MQSGGTSTVRLPPEPWAAPYQQPYRDDDQPSTATPPAFPKLEPFDLVRLAVSGWWIVLIVLAATVGAAAYTTAQRESCILDVDRRPE
jgi:hypothetical protein